MAAYTSDNMSRFLGSYANDQQAQAFGEFLETRGWQLIIGNDGQYVAYRYDEEMTEQQWMEELSAFTEE